MARRSGRASAAAAAATAAAEAVEQQEEEAPETGQAGLQFDEPLTWRAPRVIPVAELLRRLQALSKELGNIEQGENDRDSFTKVAKELAFHGLLHHKDRGVKAWLACCLVDMLRLCAPDAPYTGAQLKDIFALFITIILPSLSDPSDAYNNQHLYVLQSLAQVKSIVLLTDIPSSDALTLHLFTSFFDMMSGSAKSSSTEQIGKNVEINMTAILVILVDEATTMPVEVVDIIVAQFLRVDPQIAHAGTEKGKKAAVDAKQSTLLMKELPAAYTMAKAICNSCPERMARNVSQYFNEVIMDASNSSGANGNPSKSHGHRRTSKDYDDSDDEAGGAGPTDDDLKELHKAHRLIRELWRASPAVLQSVIPQLEAELSAENIQLRLLATETLGDIVSGIGAAGPPPNPVMDPSVYPPATLSDPTTPSASTSVLTIPSSPQPFPQTHPAAYSSYLNRRNDKSAVIRSAWITGVGRILATSAGGVGLGQSDEEMLLRDFATKLGDADERVRLAAVKAVAGFNLKDIVTKLSAAGGVDKEGSILANLAARARDRKHNVRVEAMRTLGRIWGVAAGEIAAGTEAVKAALGSIPSKLFDTFYVNDVDINVLLDHVLFELLLPLSYPPLKSKPTTSTTATPTTTTTQPNGSDASAAHPDADDLRTSRILTLVSTLDPKAKKAFFALATRQTQLAKIMSTFIKKCEDHNGGVMDPATNATEIKAHLSRLIDYLSLTLPDNLRVSADLWKFATLHDRRAYQLVRFCMDPDSDYRTVQRAIREIWKRIETSPASPAGLLDTLTPLLYRVSLLIYNKSHVPAIVRLSHAADSPLAATANELLLSISATNPAVFKAHVQSLCTLLTSQAPTATAPNDRGSVDTLKACAGFARRFPAEMPTDRKFLQSLVAFALYGTPPKAAKYAVTVLLAAGGERREMHARDLVEKSLKDVDQVVGSEGGQFLARLATLGQLWLLAPVEVDTEADRVVDLAIKDVLLKPTVIPPPTPTGGKRGTRAGKGKAEAEDEEKEKEGGESEEWVSDDKVPTGLEAKLLALRLLTNRLLSHTDDATRVATARPVLQLLTTLVAKSGELSKTTPTPAAHRSRLRLQAALLLLKLCTKKEYDALFSAGHFNTLAFMAQDGVFEVRHAFVQKLKKHLGQARLPQRFYAPVFLLAYEPRAEFKEDTLTWVRSRAAHFAREKHTAMESAFARVLSLLAHHPDFGTEADDLVDFARYLLFYLAPVGRPENVGLILHIAQRVKQTVDAIDAKKSENLYYLSDLAQAVVRRFASQQGWALETWPGKVRLPAGLFGALAGHDAAQAVATKEYVGEDVRERLDGLVRATLRSGRKRRAGGEAGEEKKPKRSRFGPSAGGLPIRKSSGKGAAKKAKRKNDYDEDDDEGGLPEGVPESSIERRRSGRGAASKTYAEDSDSEMEEAEAEVEEGDDEDVEMGEAGDDDEAESPEEEEAPPAPKSKSKAKTKAKAKANGKAKKAAPPAAAKPTVGARSSRTRGDAVAAAMGTASSDDDDSDLSNPPSESA